MSKYRIIDFGDCVAKVITPREAREILTSEEVLNPSVICFDDNGKDWWVVKDEWELEDYIDYDTNENQFAVEVLPEELFSQSSNQVESDITKHIVSATDKKDGVDCLGYPVAGTREIIWKIWCDLNHTEFVEGGDYYIKCKGIDIDELIKYILM